MNRSFPFYVLSHSDLLREFPTVFLCVNEIDRSLFLLAILQSQIDTTN